MSNSVMNSRRIIGKWSLDLVWKITNFKDSFFLTMPSIYKGVMVKLGSGTEIRALHWELENLSSSLALYETIS